MMKPSPTSSAMTGKARQHTIPMGRWEIGEMRFADHTSPPGLLSACGERESRTSVSASPPLKRRVPALRAAGTDEVGGGGEVASGQSAIRNPQSAIIVALDVPAADEAV